MSSTARQSDADSARFECSQTGERYEINIGQKSIIECPGCGRKHEL